MQDDLLSLLERARAEKTFDDSTYTRLRSRISEDGVVSRAEAHSLVALKNACPELTESEVFAALYVEALTSFLLYTGKTPGALDEIEFVWLKEHINRDEKRDELEKKLLQHLRWKAASVPLAFERFSKSGR